MDAKNITRHDLALEVGRRLRPLMKSMGIQVVDLADMIDSNTSSISGYLNGWNVPNALALLKIADALGVSMDFLCGRDGDPFLVIVNGKRYVPESDNAERDHN